MLGDPSTARKTTNVDCEKVDLLMMDALYDELDELTLASFQRHIESCGRCSAAWVALKATRAVGVLPLSEVPPDLEARILRAAERAKDALPWPKRIERAVSWAASYAMRPQMAMAAMVVFGVGISIFFIRVRPSQTSPAQVSVTERGEPARNNDVGIVADQPASPNDKALARAHGAQIAEAPRVEPSALASAAPSIEGEAATASAVALADDPAPEAKDAPARAEHRSAAAAGALAKPMQARPASDMKGDRFAQADTEATPQPDFAAPPPPSVPKKSKAATDDLVASRDDALGGAGQAAPAPRRRAAGAPAEIAASAPPGGAMAGSGVAAGPAATATSGQDDFQAAKALYNAGRYAEAVARFDRVATTNGPNAAQAAYYAALSVQSTNGSGGGCPNAVGRFEAIATRYAGALVVGDALWHAATCQKTLGNVTQARADYLALRNFSTYRDRADRALAALGSGASPAPAEASRGETRAPAATKPSAPASPPAAASPAPDNGARP